MSRPDVFPAATRDRRRRAYPPLCADRGRGRRDPRGVGHRRAASSRATHWEHAGRRAPPSSRWPPRSRARAGRRSAGAARATCRPSTRRPIYARTSGYLKAWQTDIGTPVKKGAAAGRDRDPGSRPGTAPGAGGSGNRPGELRARAHHQRALEGPAGTQSVSQQDADQRAGDAAAKAARAPVRRRQRRASAATGIVQARAGALRRRGYPAQHRRRRAHQRRPKPGQRAVPRRRHPSAAHLRLGAAAVRARGMHARAQTAAGVRRPPRQVLRGARSPTPPMRSMPARAPCRSSCRSTTPTANCCPAPMRRCTSRSRGVTIRCACR